MLTQHEEVERGKVNRRVVMWMLLFIGYEWFVSGINKLLSGEYLGGFQGEVSDAVSKGTPHFGYGALLNSLVVPHAELFAIFIMAAEIFAGAAFLLVAIFSLANGTFAAWVAKLGIGASIVSAFLGINIFLFAGGPYFFLQGDPFDGGVTVDFLMFLFSLPLIGYFYSLNQVAKNKNCRSAQGVEILTKKLE